MPKGVRKICGTTTIVRKSDLLSGNTSSCGCIKKEQTKMMMRSHGMSNTPEFVVWCEMLQRCENKNNHSYHNYGGRGMRVCDRWKKFESFISDMGRRPTDEYTIERVDVNKGYSPDNCIWIHERYQMRNIRNSRLYTWNGKTMCLRSWSEELGLSYCALMSRAFGKRKLVPPELFAPVRDVGLRTSNV